MPVELSLFDVGGDDEDAPLRQPMPAVFAIATEDGHYHPGSYPYEGVVRRILETLVQTARAAGAKTVVVGGGEDVPSAETYSTFMAGASLTGRLWAALEGMTFVDGDLRQRIEAIPLIEPLEDTAAPEKT